jgi:Rrf2 family nitric oxide-sensitive transcriptional repressor
MQLTTMTDYGLRLLMYVGTRTDRLCTIAEVATAHGISEAHLMKVTHRLAVAGYLETVRGKGGGMRLARPASAINLGDVVNDLEPDFHLVECLGGSDACALTGRCRFTAVVSGALEAFERELARWSLADVLPCAMPSAPRGAPRTARLPAPAPLRFRRAHTPARR